MWRSSVSGRRGQKLLLFFISISSLLQISSSIVFVKTKFHHFLFDDAPATFAAPLACSEICGSMYLANPLDACSPLQNVSKGVAEEKGVRFALIERGLCTFEDKIRNAQDAGFGAVVVFDNQFKNSLVSMVGDSQGIHVPAVFVLKSAGEILKKFAQSEEGECRICVASEEMIQTVLIISLISLIVIASILALFLFARNLRSRQVRSHLYPVTMSNQMVKDLPCFKYNPSGPRINHMAESCTICLEDYRDGETLRVLPCQHEFHAACVDSWLTKWGTFCPLCKHDMRAGKLNYRVSEQTPLLPC